VSLARDLEVRLVTADQVRAALPAVAIAPATVAA
jgi:hypothetical protein